VKAAQPLVLHNIGTLCTMDGSGDFGLGTVADAVIVVVDGRIDAVGPRGMQVPADADTIDCEGNAVLPGFVDCHTHAVFAGNRADEFARRSRGESYVAIAAAGGGIRSTMRAVREASVDELVQLAAVRARSMLRRGVTTVEVKSGYGLSVEHELKMLVAAQLLPEHAGVDVVTTLLAAHAVPPECASATAWIDVIISELLPEVARAKLATACDVFIEQGAFSVDDSRRLLRAAQQHGLAAVVHAEQLSWQGGALLAAEVGARSAGHLEFITANDAEALARAGVVAEVLATAQVFLKGQRPIPGRLLRDAGCVVAIGSDLNPGTANCADLTLAAGLSVTQAGLVADEALYAMTAGSARALGLADRGSIEVGKRADVVVVDGRSPYEVLYRWGEGAVRTVIAAGVVRA
jgi:imidazolonepropionase